MTLQCDFQLSLIISLPIKFLTCWFYFYLFFYIVKKIFNRGILKGYRQQLRHFKHRVKHEIGWYPKYLLIFTAYQVQGWCTMIIITLKSQTNVSNVWEIILKRSWHTHLKHSKPYIFILQKVKNTPDGFCAHLLFALVIIIIFGGLFF